MKTIEEKARAYDEALEKAKDFYKGYKQRDNQLYANDLETIFPELCESEDEKIRKEIIKFLELPHRQFVGERCQEEWIAWLKKQGDNNNEDADILQRFSFYSYKDEPNVLYLSNVFVNEEYRNKGIGTKILKIADEVSTYLKCNSIRLKTENGSNAESLYRKNGYKTLKEEGNQIWLEKQGEKSVNKLQVSEELYEHIRNTCACIDDALSSETLADIKDYLSMAERSANNVFDMIEKQGEQESDPREENLEELLAADDIYQMAMNDDMVQEAKTKAINALSELQIGKLLGFENQDEQKPTDNNEQKFHEGDWVVDNQGLVHQIERVVENVTTHTFGYDIVGGGYFNDESDVRLWTIQDAKDGDVLVFKNNIGGIIICKSPSDYDTRSYCRLIRDNLINKEESGWDSTLLVPATKEQRDTLFTKMKKAGYEWDAEKKELKKIEDEEYNGEDYGIDSLYHAQRILEKTLGSVDGYQTDDGILSHRCAITAIKKLYKQQPAWSEEDETNSCQLKTLFENLTKDIKHEFRIISENDRDKYTAWLKSIKDRVIPQPKQEWTEEDEKRLKSCLNILQPKTLLGNVETINTKWLKSLKDRYTWRPSNEQIDTLEHFVRSIGESGYASPYDNNTKLLYSLLEQLKKLKA